MIKYNNKKSYVIISKNDYFNFIGQETILEFEEKLNSLLVMTNLMDFNVIFFKENSILGDVGTISFQKDNKMEFSFIIRKQIGNNEFSTAQFYFVPSSLSEKQNFYNKRTENIKEVNDILDDMINIICKIKN